MNEQLSNGQIVHEQAMQEQVMQEQTMNDLQVEQAALELEGKSPQQVLAWALGRFGQHLGICSGLQADGCALIDMAWRIDPNVRVFTIDSGRLPEETHQLISRIYDRYGIRVEVYLPEAAKVEAMVARHGDDLFRESVDLRLMCCQVRKVLPLKRALLNYRAWVTGLRRDQSVTRANIRTLEIDRVHGGIVKLAPLADWTDRDVWDYVRRNDVPYNALYDQGYQSIGCAPCTRAVVAGEDARSGRWWWETDAPKECGMHCSIESGSLERKVAARLGATNGSLNGNGHNGNGSGPTHS
jgi:phosphoadenosine phosphosulfate reductase